jgi:hypothetical protein
LNTSQLSDPPHFSLVTLNFCLRARVKCVGHSFAYVTHFVLLLDVWIRTQWLSKKAREPIFRENLEKFWPVKEEKYIFPEKIEIF